jgi:hypothetical protein
MGISRRRAHAPAPCEPSHQELLPGSDDGAQGRTAAAGSSCAGTSVDCLKQPAFAKATAGNLRLHHERRLERATGIEPDRAIFSSW